MSPFVLIVLVHGLVLCRMGMIAHLFSSAHLTLPNLRSDRLAGLCSEPSLITRLWRSVQRRHKVGGGDHSTHSSLQTDLSNPFASASASDPLTISLSLFQVCPLLIRRGI